MNALEHISKNLIGTCLSAVERREYDWVFTFADKIGLGTPGLWRIVDGERIVLCSGDHAQQFGLPAPIDGAQEAKNHLTGKPISSVDVRKKTGDLTIGFGNDIELELFTESSGYEGWSLWMSRMRVIVLGGGELAYWTDYQRI